MKTMTTPTKVLHTAALTLFLAAMAAPSLATTTFTGNLKGVTITDAQAVNKPPVANFSYSISGNTVSFNASGSSDTDGSITEYKWDFGDGTFGSGAQVQHTYTTNTNTPVTLTLVDNNKAVSLTQATILFQEPFNLAVNFQPSNVAIPTGFVVDSGLAFDATKGYGWSTPPSSSGTRDRDSNLSPDQAYDTMIHVSPKGVWEAAVPSGTYIVTICAGDPGFAVGTPAVQVERTNVMAGEALSSTKIWIEKTTQIDVTDGRLTLTFTGSTDPARLNWVKITNK